MEKLLKFMVKQGVLQLAFLNTNWVDILEAAAMGENDALLFWGFLTQHQGALNTEMYKPWGNTFRQTVVSSEAKAAMEMIVKKVSHLAALGIVKELLALCNSSGGIHFYRSFFRGFVIDNFRAGTLVENRIGDIIGKVDVEGDNLVIN